MVRSNQYVAENYADIDFDSIEFIIDNVLIEKTTFLMNSCKVVGMSLVHVI